GGWDGPSSCLAPADSIVRVSERKCKVRPRFSQSTQTAVESAQPPFCPDSWPVRSWANCGDEEKQDLEAPAKIAGTRGDSQATWMRRSRTAGDLDQAGNGQWRLVHPAAGIRSAMPALQRDGADLLAFLVVEDLEVSLNEAGPHLGR